MIQPSVNMLSSELGKIVELTLFENMGKFVETTLSRQGKFEVTLS